MKKTISAPRGRISSTVYLLLCAIPAVGTILSVALVSVPALTARLWTDRVGHAMGLAALIGAVSGVAGLVVSTQWRIAAGGAIALAGSAVFVVSWLLTGQWKR